MEETGARLFKQDPLGCTERSMSQVEMIGCGELGGFVVRNLSTGVEFRLGCNHLIGGIIQFVWEIV